MRRDFSRLSSRPALQHYGIAVLGVLLTAFVRHALDPILHAELPLFLFIVPIIVSASFGGLWPGLVATLLSMAVGDYLFVSPRGLIFPYTNALSSIHSSMLVLIGTVFSILFDRMHKTYQAHLWSLEVIDEKLRFTSTLNDALRPLADPEEILTVALRMLGEHLKADRVVYAEVRKAENHLVITGEYVRNKLPSILGSFAMSDFDDRELSILREDRPYVLNDIVAGSPPGTDLSFYERRGIRSLVCVPVSKKQDFTARLAVHQGTSRTWSQEEIRLITLVANRCWESIERARALKKLSESDERYRAFIANSSEAIWRFEFERPISMNLSEDEQIEKIYESGYLGECNVAMARRYGYENPAEIVGARLNDLAPRSNPRSIAYVLAVIRANYQLSNFETRQIDAAGNTRYFLNNTTPIQNNGNVLRVWGNQRDITEQKAAEEAVRESGDRLRQILQQMPIGVAIVEAPSGRLRFHNPEAARLLGQPLLQLNDYTELSQYGALHEDGTPYKPEEYPIARAVVSREVVKNEQMKYRRANGTETYLSVDSAPIYDSEGRIVAGVSTFIDVGERKRAEEELRESEERFSKAFRASPDSLVISRVSDGVILEANDSFVSLSGYSKEELIGKSTIELGLYADPAIRDRALTMMKERNFVHDYEFPMKRKSGEIRQVSFSAEPLELHGTHCWLTLGRDITERKQVEHEREQLLSQEKAAREEAESANRLKDEFLATISHELRTPLTSILGWATMLSSNSLSESQVHHALDVITQSAKSQGRLIDDILDTSRIITGRLRLDSRLVEIDQVFQDAIDVVRPTAEAKKIQLHVVIRDERSMVFGDVNRLQQAIWNLLSNAVKFTNPGGRIDAWLTRKENLIEISISDTGVGIDPEFLPHVFERFRQADSTSTRRYGGLGLGLAIVRYIVEMHGGAVSASSRGKGQGSNFTIQFPVSSLEIPTLETQAPPTDANELVPSKSTDHYQRLDGLRVLIVDDDRDTLEMLQFILQGQGATVMTAGSTAEAMRSLDTCPPDVLVSDIAMPEQDGYALIAQVRSRSRETGGEVPAIALTAYARSEDRVRALTAGFQTYVVKPVEPGEFVAVIASLMKRS